MAADQGSEQLLRGFLRGEDIKRWRIESDDLFLINTPKGEVDIEAYPAVRDWLLPFRKQLEARATKQEWWEIQQAQLAYQAPLSRPKIVWPHFQHERSFSLDDSGEFLNNKCFFLPTADNVVLSLLNSTCIWFQLFTLARAKRGGYIEAEAQYVEQLHMPDVPSGAAVSLGSAAEESTSAARRRHVVQAAVRRRILDLAPPGRRKLNGKLRAWHELDFAAFRAEIKKAFRVEIPLKQRGEWEGYLFENATEVRELGGRITSGEKQIDAIVYRLFDLSPADVALIEGSMVGAVGDVAL